MNSRTSHPARIAVGLALALASGLVLSACSSAGAPGGPSSSGAPGAGSGSDAEYAAQLDEYDLELAKCIRGKGVDVADPKPGEGTTDNSPAAQQAASECRKDVGDPPTRVMSAEDEAKTRATLAAWSKCLREKGYDAPDPGPGDGFQEPAGVTVEDMTECTSMPE